MRDEREKSPPLNRLFWPRPGGRDLSAEVDYDRPCPICGYNLRGMPMRSRCPECGSLGGWGLEDEAIAWDDRQTFWAFLSTCCVAMFHPHLLARHLCLPVRMDLAAARKFRRIAVTIAAVSFCAVAFLITMCATNMPIAVGSIPFQSAAIIVWLNATTLEPLLRLKDWSGNDAIARRVQVLVHYLSAPLILSPLHLVIFFVASDFAMHRETWFAVPVFLLALLCVQLLFASIALGWMHYELIETPRMQAQAMGFGWMMTSLTTGAVMMIGIPALLALLAWQILG